MDKLFPCPFCGREAEVSVDPMPIYGQHPYCIFVKHLDSCYLTNVDPARFKTQEEAIFFWSCSRKY